MIMEEITQDILKLFNLPSWNVLIQAGGKTLILLPNLEDNDAKISDQKREIEQIVWQKFNAEIKLNQILSEPVKGADFQNFGKLLSSLNAKLGEQKKQPFLAALADQSDWMIHLDYAGHKLCPYCRKYPATKQTQEAKKDICEYCLRDIEIGQRLKNQSSIYVLMGKSGDHELLKNKLSINTSEAPKPAKDENLLIINPKTEDINSKIFDRAFRIGFQANHVPESKSFEQIAEQPDSYGLLAVLKADVDSLGAMFALGLKRDQSDKSIKNYDSVSRLSTMSRSLDLFFSGYLNQLISKHYPDIYITYAGGDDLVMIGHWSQIIDCAEDLSADFAAYASNPEIHLSAGISLCKPKFPIAKAIELADQQLEKAKNNPGKNSICLMDSVLKWQEFALLKDTRLQLADWLKKERVSTQFMRHLLEFGQMIRQAKHQSSNHALSWQPLLAYQIGRLLTGPNQADIKSWADKLLGLSKQVYNSEAEMALFDLVREHLSMLATYALYQNRA